MILKKPINSGNINFETLDHYNHITLNLFKLRNFELELFDLNTNNGSITSEKIYKDHIFIFPSKTIDLTQVSKSKEPRISI